MFCYRSGRTPVDEVLGRPFQEKILGLINGFGEAMDDMDRNDDPEAAEMDTEEGDPALKVYDKYGTGSS